MNNLKQSINEARIELLVRKDPANSIKVLLELVKNYDNASSGLYKNTLALAYLENKNYNEAAGVYYDINEKYQAGFCELLMGNIQVASELWKEIPDSEPSNWGKSLIELINLKAGYLPTFIQIRNHLESDLGYLIQADRLDYAENIIKCGEILCSINPESYKYIGKALFNNGFPDLSINYFLKSQKIIPQDAEIYYHLGQYSYLACAYQEGKHMLNQCLVLNSYYVPARKLLEKIENKLKKN